MSLAKNVSIFPAWFFSPKFILFFPKLNGNIALDPYSILPTGRANTANEEIMTYRWTLIRRNKFITWKWIATLKFKTNITCFYDCAQLFLIALIYIIWVTVNRHIFSEWIIISCNYLPHILRKFNKSVVKHISMTLRVFTSKALQAYVRHPCFRGLEILSLRNWPNTGISMSIGASKVSKS
jgi:hypothetical protein